METSIGGTAGQALHCMLIQTRPCHGEFWQSAAVITHQQGGQDDRMALAIAGRLHCLYSSRTRFTGSFSAENLMTMVKTDEGRSFMNAARLFLEGRGISLELIKPNTEACFIKSKDTS